MPIFNNNITFLHIPKSGGTSIEKFLLHHDYKMSLFTSTGSIFINGHTPQHCTFLELEELGLLTEKIFTVIRPEVDRVVSEYFYILNKRPDLKKLFNNFDEFLELFLNKNNCLLFDNHNLSNNDFLINKYGLIDERINFFDFFDYTSIEKYLGIKGLLNFHHNSSQNNINKSNLSKSQLYKIKKYFSNENS